MSISKRDDGSATWTTPHGAFEFDPDEFDDLVHAIPLNTTALYRLLVDTLVTQDERRAQLRSVIEGKGNADETLNELQQDLQPHLPQDD